MRRSAVRWAMIASVVVALPLFAGGASAQYREFIGRIDKISGSRMLVDNRKGDKVTFVPAEKTAVEGQGKKSWKALKKDDWVSVSWKMMDKPRVAYRVVVMPPRKEAGEDE